jgi:hypothetical protein
MNEELLSGAVKGRGKRQHLVLERQKCEPTLFRRGEDEPLRRTGLVERYGIHSLPTLKSREHIPGVSRRDSGASSCPSTLLSSELNAG